MSRIESSEEQLEQVAFERFHHPHPRVQQAIGGVFLFAKEMVRDLAEPLGI